MQFVVCGLEEARTVPHLTRHASESFTSHLHFLHLGCPSRTPGTWTLLHDDVPRQDTENKKRELFRQTSQESLMLCKDTEVREIRRFDCEEGRNPDFSPLLFLRTRDMSYTVRDMSSNSE